MMNSGLMAPYRLLEAFLTPLQPAFFCRRSAFLRTKTQDMQ